MYKRINGIQHVGVGVAHHEDSWRWYRKFLGLDIAMFNGVAPATNAIPTVSEWGLIVLSLGMLISATLVMRRRQTAPQTA